MTTYSGTPNTPYFSEKLLNEYNYTQIEGVLLKLPDNNNQLIKPKSVRDAVFSLWENIAIKNTGIGATARYIGIDDDTNLKFYFGKRKINGGNVMTTTLLNGDSDYYFYNNKGDTFSSTKISFLAGTNTNIFTYSPYLQVKQVGSSSVAMEFINKGGDIIIGDGTQNVKIYGASGSVGMLNSVGSFGTLQVKGTGNSLNSIAFGDIGSALIIGTNGYLTFSTIAGSTTSMYNINQILRQDNNIITDIKIDSPAKLIFNSATPSGISFSNTLLYESIKDFNIINTIATISITAKTFKLNSATPSKFKFLMANDTSGTVVWENISTYVDYSNISNKPSLNYLPLTGGRVDGELRVNGAAMVILNENLVLSSEEYGIKYTSQTFDTSTVLKFNGVDRFVGSKLNYTELEDLPDLSDVVIESELQDALSLYATTYSLTAKLDKNSNPEEVVISDTNNLITSGEYYIANIALVSNLPSAISGGGMYITVKVSSNGISQIIHAENNRIYTRIYVSGGWTAWN